MSRGVALLVACVTAVLVAGCPVDTDNGKECVLLKKGPNDGGGVPITESEVTPGKDFVSFGAPECADFVCVRAASAPKTGDPNATAYGRCSSRCASQDDKCPSAVSNVRLDCRALILDEETLGRLCQQDPTKCERYFGGAQTPWFCAEPGTVDAGS
jgi:hypothetical protein